MSDTHPQWILEEARQVSHWACLPLAVGKLRKAHQVQHQWGREDRVASLPDELKAHFCAQITTEVDKIPRRLPITQRRNILDENPSVRGVAEGGGQDTRLAPQFGALMVGIIQHLSVAPPQDVEPLPGEYFQVSEPEQWCQHRFH